MLLRSTVARVPQASFRALLPLSGRAASTSSAVAEVLSPAVAFLVGAKNIDEGTLKRLPRSGPKNNLLKGDVLRFLANPSILGQSVAAPEGSRDTGSESNLAEEPVAAAYYGARVVVNDLVTFVKNYNDEYQASLSVSDLFTRATVLALQAVPEANAQWDASANAKKPLDSPQVLISRLSPLGSSRMLLAKSEKVGGVKINKMFKDDRQVASSPIFSLYDAVLAPSVGVSPYPTATEPVILSLGSIRKAPSSGNVKGSRSDDLFDFLSSSVSSKNTPSTSSKSTSPPKANLVLESTKKPQKPSITDDIDFLAAPPGGTSFYTGSASGECETGMEYALAVDLTVDKRVVDRRTAEKFLKVWEGSLAEPKALL
ncbi:Pyruvate dehydrogenase complex component E2 1 [Thoreauomyces humboldtii]|nr:Pyruvate dehydrogenase complex component E2 1 [Thoreauomyces humboldtii]